MLEYLKSTKHFEYELWAGWKILIGEDWDKEIQIALKQCDFGLLLLSLPFLNSDYIQKNELPELLEIHRALPIGFESFDFSTYDLKGLQARQIFCLDDQCYERYKNCLKNIL